MCKVVTSCVHKVVTLRVLNLLTTRVLKVLTLYTPYADTRFQKAVLIKYVRSALPKRTTWWKVKEGLTDFYKKHRRFTVIAFLVNL